MRDTIISDACDGCGRRGPVVKCHDSGDVPSFSACAACMPKEFERQSRFDIDVWLAGGPLPHIRRVQESR